MMRHTRQYDGVISRVDDAGPREDRMHAVADALWEAFVVEGVSWVGFYVDHPDQPDDRRLILGPCRDKPACSPIGLHGACGKALIAREVLIVRDVAELGEGYIACDARDRSEIVVPLIDDDDACWGVLDIDSWEVAAFTAADARGLIDVLVAAGLTSNRLGY